MNGLTARQRGHQLRYPLEPYTDDAAGWPRQQGRYDVRYHLYVQLLPYQSIERSDKARKEAAEAKIHAFISMLGADAKRLLLEGEEIESHELFTGLISKKTITGNDEGPRDPISASIFRPSGRLREEDPTLFESIKRLPKS